MAKVIGPLFSMMVSGSFGDIVFDRRGFIRTKGHYRDPKTNNQGDFRQAMMVAQKCVKACGPQTRQQLRRLSDEPARWSAYLLKHLMGSNRSNYKKGMGQFLDPAVDQAGWEAAALTLGMEEVKLSYANDVGVSPGAQLFLLAVTLFSLELYPHWGSRPPMRKRGRPALVYKATTDGRPPQKSSPSTGSGRSILSRP